MIKQRKPITDHYAPPSSNLVSGALLSQAEVIAQHGGYFFSDLTQPDDLIVAEHLEQLAATSGFSKISFTRAFNELVDQGGHLPIVKWDDNEQKHRQSREPKPLSNIVAIRRTDCGLRPYDTKDSSQLPNEKVLKNYGLVAGTVLKTLTELGHTTNKKPNATEKALGLIAFKLADQLKM